MKGIILVRSGVIKIVVRSSLFNVHLIQELYPRCSYGTYAFFVDDKNEHKKSKFSLIA